MSALLTLDSVSVSYGHIEAVRGVSLTIDKGRIVTIIGPNGAGKTTLMLATMGLLPSSGRIAFEGADLDGVDVEDRVERGMCLVPERRELFHDMSVADNLLLGSYARRDRSGVQGDLDDVFARFPRLKERRKQHAGTLSGGERQMLALGRALMGRPKLLMLDDPFSGLDVSGRVEFTELLGELVKDGQGLVLVCRAEDVPTGLKVKELSSPRPLGAEPLARSQGSRQREEIGSTLIDQGIPGAKVVRDFAPGGLVCTIQVCVTAPGESHATQSLPRAS